MRELSTDSLGLLHLATEVPDSHSSGGQFSWGLPFEASLPPAAEPRRALGGPVGAGAFSRPLDKSEGKPAERVPQRGRLNSEGLSV